MNIQYYGHSCFKITTKPAGRATEDVAIFLDPFEKEIGLRPPQGQADLILVSHQHYDHNNVSALKGEPTTLNTPGEYSVKGINIIGVDSFHDDKEGQERGKNTIFIIETEGIKICHLGDLGGDLSPKQLGEIDGSDILMIPVGGNFTINGKKAAEITKKIEPKVVIPMHYKVPGTKAAIDDEKAFCDAMGNCPKDKINKITLKEKDLTAKNMEVLLMNME